MRPYICYNSHLPGALAIEAFNGCDHPTRAVCMGFQYPTRICGFLILFERVYPGFSFLEGNLNLESGPFSKGYGNQPHGFHSFFKRDADRGFNTLPRWRIRGKPFLKKLRKSYPCLRFFSGFPYFW